jgi:AcrR family transcriptional regulator
VNGHSLYNVNGVSLGIRIMTRLATEIRQEQIAQAVLAIVAESGLDGLSMAAVARRLGVVPSALYRHYPNKDEMVFAGLRLLLKTVMTEMGRSEPGRGDWRDAFKRLIGIFRKSMPVAVVFPRVVFSVTDNGSQKLRRKTIRDLQDKMLGRIASILREGIAEGQVAKDLDVEAAALLFWGALVSSTVRWYLTDGEFDTESYLSQALELFFKAIEGGSERKAGKSRTAGRKRRVRS